MDHDRALFLGETYVRMRRGQRALEVLARADNEDARTWLWRANALHTLERDEESAECAKRGLAIDPDSPYLYHALALAEFHRQRLEEADAATEAALRIVPEYAEVLALRSLILEYRGRPVAASRVSRQAAEHAPEDKSVRGAAMILALNRRETEAADALSSAILTDAPDDAGAHFLRALSCASRSRLDQAARHYREAAMREPENAAYTRAARISNHWLLWPLRVTSPFGVELASPLLSIALVTAFVAGGRAWDFFWYAVAYYLYGFAGFLAVSTLPLAKK